MPTIVLPNTQVDGDPADAAEVSQNLYTPNAVTASSLAAINGVLDKDNLDPATLPLEREAVRRDAYSGGGFVGATANQDYYRDWYAAFKGPLSRPNASAVAIPGAALTYRIPTEASVVYIKWQISLIAQGKDVYDPGGDIGDFTPAWPKVAFGEGDLIEDSVLLRLYVDGKADTRFTQEIKASQLSVYDRAKTKHQYRNSPTLVDHRNWTCIAAYYPGDPFSSDLSAGVLPPFAAGFHSAELRITSNGPQVRVKVRNMSYRYVR